MVWLFRWTPLFWMSIAVPVFAYTGLLTQVISFRMGGILVEFAMLLMVFHIVQSSVFPRDMWLRWCVQMVSIVPWYFAILLFLYNGWFREEIGRTGMFFVVGETLREVLPPIYVGSLFVMCVRMGVTWLRGRASRSQ
jgi:hypothetical protein